MPEKNQNIGRKAVLNTGIMYVKAFVTAIVMLFATRIVLDQLGKNDYGTYSLMSGIVNMLAFFIWALTVSLQRFIAMELERGDRKRMQDIMRIAHTVCFCFGIGMVVVVELLGYLFLARLNIDPSRLFAARMVFHFIVVSTFFAIISTPFEASINAHEDMFVISIFYIIDSLLKLALAFYLIYTSFDKLIVYGLLMALVFIIDCLMRRMFCRYKYDEFSKRAKRKFDGLLFKKISVYVVWTSLEPLTNIFFIQGAAILLNLFGGTVANTAYGIANLVMSQILYFSLSLLSAIGPQIMKSEGRGDRKRTVKLCVYSSKLSFFLMVMLSATLVIEMPYILGLWLIEVPEYTVLFCRVIVVSSVITQMVYGFQQGIQAVGKIRSYYLSIGALKIGILVSVALLLSFGFPFQLSIYSFIFVEIFIILVRSNFAAKTMNFDSKIIYLKILPRLLLFGIIVYSATCLVRLFLPYSFIALLPSVVISVSSSLLLLKLVVLDREEYSQLLELINISSIKRKLRLERREREQNI